MTKRKKLPSGVYVSGRTRIQGCRNFTWGEATRQLTRFPKNLSTENNIIKVAQKMEQIRELLGNRPIRITSWYRPLHVNRRIGSSDNSRHIQGDAVDFVVRGLSPAHVANSLEGIQANDGLGRYPTFTHIDERGSRARWRIN